MKFGTKLEWIICAALAFIGIIVLPFLNSLPVDSWMHVSDFRITVFGKYLCYAVLALGVNLLWGYTGLLSLGQCLFFSLGGYAMGMYLMLMIGKLGQYKSDLPDFMVFLDYKELPAHWEPFYNFGFTLLMVVVVPGLLALVFGFLAFRSRIKGVYFAILSQALTYGACLMFFRNDFTFGANNGLTDFKFILGYDLNNPVTKRALYIASAVLLLGTYVSCRWITSTKFGKIQQAIRDSENRVLFSGYATANYKLFVFVVAAVISGLGGALYVPQVGIINPGEMHASKSLEAVVWVAVGGRGNLLGPILGAVGVNSLKSYATAAFAEQWLYLLGGLFVVVVLFMPDGVVGLPSQIKRLIGKLRARRAVAVDPVPTPRPVEPEEPATKE